MERPCEATHSYANQAYTALNDIAEKLIHKQKNIISDEINFDNHVV